MGSFSFLKADDLTKVANVVYGHSFKFLIPEAFGGGFIKDNYQDYGNLGTRNGGTPKYDMYELLAFWNKDAIFNGYTIESQLKYSEVIYPEFPKMKEIDEYTDSNRVIGIDLFFNAKEEKKMLKYPLKLVSASFNGKYEDLDGYSKSDPNQGFGPVYRKRKEY